jgi:tRNA 2-thiouridine synthesizing protein B
MILHTVNKSPFDATALDSCLRIALSDDTVLLIEDGVYAALANDTNRERMLRASATLIALAPDVDARGIQNQLLDGIVTVDYAGFVELTTKHSKVVSWF